MTTSGLYPKTLVDDTELISRKFETFNMGMVTDIEQTDVPQGSVPYLNNARASSNAITGRRGTTQWDSLALPQISIGDALMTVYQGATITATFDATVGATHWWIDSRITFTADAKTWTAFISDYLGNGIYVLSFGTGVDTTDIETTDATNIKVRFRINASYIDTYKDVQYYLIGEKIYARIEDNNSWIEYYVDANSTPVNSVSRFLKINDSICLFNMAGMYILSDVDGHRYAFMANSDLPTKKVNAFAGSTSAIDQSAYNYAYTFTRATGNYNVNRLDEYMFIECETPPYIGNRLDFAEGDYVPDYNNKDYTTVFCDRPIYNGQYVTYAIGSDYGDVSSWVDMSEDGENPSSRVSFNGAVTQVYFDFSKCKTLIDVAKSIETALIGYVDSNIRFKAFNSATFELFSIKNGDVVFLIDAPILRGTRIVGSSAAYPLVFDATKTYRLGNSVEYMYYPSTINALGGITHYSLYRTKDVYPNVIDNPNILDPRIQSSPEVLAWIDDVPVVKIFRANIGGGVMIITDGNYTINDISDKMKVYGGAYSLDVDRYLTTNTYKLTTDVYTGSYVCVIGSNNINVGSKTGNSMTMSDGNFNEGFVGRTIYWENGKTSVIIAVSGNTAITVDYENISSQYFSYSPTYRKYFDTTNDNVQNGYLAVYPLNTRFYTPIPNTNIVAYSNASLVLAVHRRSEIYNSDAYDTTKIGYYKQTAQTNTKLINGVTDIVNVNGIMSVFTSASTHYIDMNRIEVKATEYGESYIVIPDPIQVSGSIGMTLPNKWCHTDRNSLMVFTNEPSIREFNGTAYGDSITKGLINTHYIERMGDVVVMDYDQISGLNVWGTLNG